MKYSIKKQMIAIFIGLLACMVVALLVINMTFLEPYYIQNKEKSFREMYETLNQVLRISRIQMKRYPVMWQNRRNGTTCRF